jgi:hypothetical protein
MTNISERNHQKNELASLGYSLKYIDEWSPKITLYRHKPAYNQDGLIVEEVGTFVKGVPGEPSYVLRKAKIGLFPWRPNEGCTCQWCQARQAEGAAKAEVAQVAEAAPEPPTPETGTGKGVLGPHFKT